MKHLTHVQCSPRTRGCDGRVCEICSFGKRSRLTVSLGGIARVRNGETETMLKSAHQSPGNVCATNDTRVSPVGQGGQVPIKGHPQSRTRVRSFENLATVGCVQIRVLPHSAVDFAQARKGRLWGRLPLLEPSMRRSLDRHLLKAQLVFSDPPPWRL